jgi:hypothetical protein
MNGNDPLAAWRGNPFFLLETSPRASRAEVERAGQRLLGLLAVGSASASRYESPLGPATRDENGVRQALASLRDPNERVIQELWAEMAPRERATGAEGAAGPWDAAAEALGWRAKWPA